tara:strand:- start:70 stop:531 length:462 start_codon:yes stop_codon:yes gene_type:complete
MATRSRIGIQLADESILSVYHHWDGYPQWLGVTLNEKFNTKDKVAELLDGGDLSCCDSDTDWDRNELSESRPLYYNERGDNTEPRLDLNFDDYVNNANACEEFVYVFTRDSKWECYAINHSYDGDYNIVDTNVVSVDIPTSEDAENQILASTY